MKEAQSSHPTTGNNQQPETIFQRLEHGYHWKRLNSSRILSFVAHTLWSQLVKIVAIAGLVRVFASTRLTRFCFIVAQQLLSVGCTVDMGGRSI